MKIPEEQAMTVINEKFKILIDEVHKLFPDDHYGFCIFCFPKHESLKGFQANRHHVTDETMMLALERFMCYLKLNNLKENPMKISSVLVLGLLVPSIAFGAQNQSPSQPLYVGGDVSQTIMGLKSKEKIPHNTSNNKAASVNLYAGYKFFDYLSVEGGLFNSIAKNSNKERSKIRTKFRGAHGGVVFSHEVYQQIEAIGGIGLSMLRAQATKRYVFSHKKDFVAPRVIAGVQYSMIPNLNLRLSVVFHRLKKHYGPDQKLQMNHAYHISAGLNYLI